MSGAVLEAERPKPAVERASPSLLHEFFERQAEQRPLQPALEDGRETLSYRDLNARANQLANHLRGIGVVSGSLVGVCLGRSPRLYVALLAVLKAGAGYVPLDPNLPPERIRYILTDAGVEVLLTEQSVLETAGGIDVHRIVSMDADAAAIALLPILCPSLDPSPQSPSDICYVIYTSGTTGRPKGVMIEHRSAANFVNAIGQVYRLAPADRVYQGFSFAFDASIEEMWGAWSVGATLVPGTDEMVRSPSDVAKFLDDRRVTVFSTVPTFLAMIKQELPSVRLLVVGGEPCPAELVQRWARNGRRMLNTYGPTETTVVATCGECTLGGPVTIGRPMPGYSAYVLDGEMNPVRLGETGELYIGGVLPGPRLPEPAEKNHREFPPQPFSQSARQGQPPIPDGRSSARH